jgi:hypothetical protein
LPWRIHARRTERKVSSERVVKYVLEKLIRRAEWGGANVPEIGLLSSDVRYDHVTIMWLGFASGVCHVDGSGDIVTKYGRHLKAGHYTHLDSNSVHGAWTHPEE